MTLETTVDEAETDAEQEPEGVGDAATVLAEVEEQTYGPYIACEVVDVEAIGDGEIRFLVDIPGYEKPMPWIDDVRPADEGRNYLQRVLADHGLDLSEVDEMVGRRVLLKPDEDGEGGVDGWTIYDPRDPNGDVPEEWYAEHPFTPYEPNPSTEERVDDAVRAVQNVMLVALGLTMIVAAAALGIVGNGVAAVFVLVVGLMGVLYGLGRE